MASENQIIPDIFNSKIKKLQIELPHYPTFKTKIQNYPMYQVNYTKQVVSDSTCLNNFYCKKQDSP